MGRTSYTTLKARADAAAGVAAAETPEGKQARIDQLIADRDSEQLAKEADAIRQQHAERGEVFIKRVIDPHEPPNIQTITSSWEALTPSMCAESALHGKGGACGWDAARERNFKQGWDSVPEDMVYEGMTMRDVLLQDLQRHKLRRHAIGVSDVNVRTPEQARKARAERPLPEGFIENPRL